MQDCMPFSVSPFSRCYLSRQLLFSFLQCVLSAVILVSFKGLFLQVKDLAKLWSSSHLDGAIWLVTFVVSVVVGLDYGLLAGMTASAVVLLLRAQRPPALHLGYVPFTELYLDLDTYHKVTLSACPLSFVFFNISPLTYETPLSIRTSTSKPES